MPSAKQRKADHDSWLMNQHFVESGLDQLFEEAKQEYGENFEKLDNNFPKPGDETTAHNQFRTLCASMGLTTELEEADIEHTEMGGWTIFARLYETVEEYTDRNGIEVFESWRGTDDTDKYLKAEQFEDYSSVIRELESKGPYQESTFRESRTDNHQNKKKFTGTLNGSQSSPTESVKIDVVEPERREDEIFDFENLDSVAIGDTELPIPSIEQQISSKLDAYNSAPEKRPHDLQDIENLIYAAEKRYEAGEMEFSPDNLYKSVADQGPQNQLQNCLGREIRGMGDMLDAAVDRIRSSFAQRKSSNSYTPSGEYLNSLARNR